MAIDGVYMQQTAPLVSVIMPVYNSVYTLERAFKSVQNQSYQNWELIIVDDHSTDESWLLMNELCLEEKRARIFQLSTNQGSGITRNKAISEANGRFIAFLDADDEWLEHKLNRQINWMLDENIQFSCTSYVRKKNGKRHKIILARQKVDRDKLLTNNSVGTLTAVYDTLELGKVYMPEIRRRQDYALWLKIMESTEYVFGMNEVLSIYHTGHTSLSSNKLPVIIDQWNFFRKYLKFPRAKSALLFLSYLINSMRRNF